MGGLGGKMASTDADGQGAMSLTPSVSVVVPVYNRLELLRETVHSLKRQTLADAEFLLVDDRSDEITRQFLCALPEEDRRFRILSKPEGVPKGCQASRNLGLEHASGRYLLFLDSDDLLASDCLYKRLQFIELQVDADIVIGNQAIFYETSGECYWVNVPRDDLDDIDRFLTIGLSVDVPWINAGCLIRTSALRSVNVQWRQSFHWDDLAFHLDCLLAGLRVRWMPRSLVPDAWYRIHGGEHYGSVLMSSEGLENTSHLLRLLFRRLKDAGLLSASRAFLLRRSLFHCCILRAVDLQQWSLAWAILNESERDGMLPRRDALKMKGFVQARRLVTRSPRLRFYINRWVRRRILRQYFCECKSTYCTIPISSTEVPPIALLEVDSTGFPSVKG